MHPTRAKPTRAKPTRANRRGAEADEGKADEEETGEEGAGEEEADEGKEGPPDTDAADPFSEEALKTPEGIKAARDAITEQRRTWARDRDRKALELRERTEKLKRRDASISAKGKQIAELTKRLGGAPGEVLDALSALTGRDPIRTLEAINLAAAGKKPPNAETQQLKSELEQLKIQLAQREEQQNVQRSRESEAALIERRSNELLELAQSKPYAKLLITHSRDEARDRLLKYKHDAYVAQQPITDEDAVEKLEQHLAQTAKWLGAPGQATGSGKAEKPGSAKQKSLTSKQVAADGSTRQLTEDEYLEANAEDILRDLFG